MSAPLDEACGAGAAEAQRPDNRPGLPQIAYRIGRHGDFLARMLERIARQETPGTTDRPLAALATRATDDPSIALLDAWACTLDVLAFYQERIANEGYLGTATERLSVRELARAIGYELAPGVAAQTRLAFTVEEADDPFRSVAVPAGVQAMSVPQKPGDLPQVFETLEAIVARADFNAIPARLERPQPLALYRPDGAVDASLVLIDTDDSFDLDAIDPDARVDVTEATRSSFLPLDPSIDLAAAIAERAEDTGTPAADVVLPAVAVAEIQLRGIATNLKPGDRLLAVGQSDDVTHALPLIVREVEPDPAYAMTRVAVAPLGTAAAGAPPPVLKAIRPSISLSFRTPLLRTGTVVRSSLPLERPAIAAELRRTSWRAADLQTMVRVQRWSLTTLLSILRQPPPAKSPTLGVAAPGIYALRQRVGFFGNTAPRQELLAESAQTEYPESWDDESGETTPRPVWRDSQGNALGPDADAYLERAVEDIGPDSWAVIETPGTDDSGGALTRHLTLRVGRASTVSRSDFAISGKVTALLFNAVDGADFNAAGASANFTFRKAIANVASTPLAAAGLPIREDVAAGDTVLTLGRLVLELLPGKAVAVLGERTDAAGVSEDEIAILEDVRHIGGFTRLTFGSGLQRSYRRSSVTVNANVALASHGELFEESLGSGDATLANQAFALKKLPLTFLVDDKPPGRRSTLSVRVDGIEWQERPSLYEAGPEDRVYTVRIDEDGTTRVVFGDGVRGARLPTGTLNVVARYRAGIGLKGEVAAGAIMLLKTRPLGVRSVTNPDAASGAQDTESMADARQNAPSTVRTLGRVVSLSDYEDVGRIWPGFAKARAEVLWQGSERLVHVTVGTAGGESPLPTDPALAALRDAIDGMRDGADRVLVQGFRELPFAIEATLVADLAYDADAVGAAARAALEAAYGYAAAELAAPVSGASVIAALQAVPGVVRVDLDRLEPVDAPGTGGEGHSALLRARPAELAPDGTSVLAAELLLVSPAHIELAVETADG